MAIGSRDRRTSPPAPLVGAGARAGLRRVVFASVLVYAMLACATDPLAGRAEAAPATAAPEWTLPTSEGGEVSLRASLAKGPVLVSFWAMWCGPCLRELPHLDAIAKEFEGRLTVLAVNRDSPRGVARVRPYLKSKGLRLTVPLDTSGDVARRMQVGDVLPFLVLYDAQGREVYRNVGYRDGGEAVLREQVRRVLGGAPADSAATP